MDPDESEFGRILDRLESEGLLVKWPNTPHCEWIVSDGLGSTYCTHPMNSPVHMARLGRRVGACCVGSCPFGALFSHQAM